jgi:hypothetical protein
MANHGGLDTMKRQLLNINSFWSLAQARVIIGDWKHDYNHRRRFLGLAELLCDVA